MKLVIINGPNLNMLGVREPDKYGSKSYDDLVAKIKNHCAENEIEAEFYQSNHEETWWTGYSRRISSRPTAS